MKFTLFSTTIFLIIVSAIFIESVVGLSHPLELITSNVDRHSQNVANFLAKRRLQDKNTKKSRTMSKRKSSDCNKKSCPIELKPCPKDCPQSCGYLDSPDPCCPLLGKPTCPDY